MQSAHVLSGFSSCSLLDHNSRSSISASPSVPLRNQYSFKLSRFDHVREHPSLSLRLEAENDSSRQTKRSSNLRRKTVIMAVQAPSNSNSSSSSTIPPSSHPLKVIISGAPASGKGTQCEEVVKKYGLTHISAGDLLRAEVAAETEYGKKCREFMDAGKLVPDDVVITIVKKRLAQPDAQAHGWLLDGYPRSASQAAALEKAGIRPELFILLEVPDEILVDRVVGRRLDPVTGRIYHLTFSPPESDEIAQRLTSRSDDTEEKVKTRLQTHNANVASVLATYKDVIATVDGNRAKGEVFADIDRILTEVQGRAVPETSASAPQKEEGATNGAVEAEKVGVN
eukprot:TRINITY_DN178_c0_g1_i4.p1 TRINITY_DN178_c0_g1~~TRINITY_DN178_c0_g1_i4.p1  ORF type:complete len:340 (+),score=75.48 TRINITY_DN178_c0_g1_i4:111-1130(+)